MLTFQAPASAAASAIETHIGGWRPSSVSAKCRVETKIFQSVNQKNDAMQM
jgi:hypothetical protein